MKLILTDSLGLRLPDVDPSRNELGNQLWTASVMLGGVLRSNPELVKGKNVLEIGAGLGACGFCSAALGASSTTIADCGEKTLRQLADTLVEYQRAKQEQQELTEEEHLASDGESDDDLKTTWDASNVSLRRHLWEEDLEFVESAEENRRMDFTHHWSKNSNTYQEIPTLQFDETFDVLLASDVLYFSCQEIPLLAAIKLHLRKKGVCILLQTMRTNNVSIWSRFLLAAQQQFKVTVRDVSPEDVCDILGLQEGVNETPHTTGYKLATFRFPLSE